MHLNRLIGPTFHHVSPELVRQFTKTKVALSSSLMHEWGSSLMHECGKFLYLYSCTALGWDCRRHWKKYSQLVNPVGLQELGQPAGILPMSSGSGKFRRVSRKVRDRRRAKCRIMKANMTSLRFLTLGCFIWGFSMMARFRVMIIPSRASYRWLC